MVVICDTSALSALAETALLALLAELFGEIVIIESVQRECLHSGAPQALRDWIASPPEWLSILPDPETLLPETSGLGRGEAASISLAWQHRRDCRLILDERRGRRVAQALGLTVTGVLAICAEAANRGLVDFDDAVEQLRSVAFRISDTVIAAVRSRLRRNSAE
jgi:predicted nucleic acid-binding protein